MDPDPILFFLFNNVRPSVIGGLSVVIAILLIFSAFFSAAEAAYFAANRIRLKNMESNGSKGAKKVLKQLDKFGKIINTISIGNNVVNITAASLSTILFGAFIANQTLSTALSTAVLTFLVLVFGEIIPKNIGRQNPEKTAIFAQPILAVIQIILTPFIWFFGLWRKIYKPKKAVSFTDEELITIIEEAEVDGEIDIHESKLIRSAIEFDDVELYDIMVPRVNAVFIKDTDSTEFIAETFKEHGFSRLPVYHDSIDSVIGILHEKDFYSLLREGEGAFSIMQPALCLSGKMKISAALRTLQKNKTHMAVVVDEFGGTSGIVTMEDILEELVGEIYDEHDEEEELLFKCEKEDTFIISGQENLDDFFEKLGLGIKDEFDSASVGGWVTEQMQRIPLVGEGFNYKNVDITVLNADEKKVIEIRAVVKTDESSVPE